MDHVVFVLLEPYEIDDLKNTDAVHNEKNDKPDLLVISCGSPERDTFPN